MPAHLPSPHAWLAHVAPVTVQWEHVNPWQRPEPRLRQEQYGGKGEPGVFTRYLWHHQRFALQRENPVRLECTEPRGTEPGAGHAPQDLARRKDKHHTACAGPLSGESQLSLVGTSGPHALYQPHGGTGYPRVGNHRGQCVALPERPHHHDTYPDCP